MRCENKPLLQDDPRFFQDITSTAVEVGLRPEVFSGTSISQGAQYLVMDTVNSPSKVGHELMC